MTRRIPPERIVTEHYVVPRRSFNPLLIMVIILVTIIVALAIVIGVGAVDIMRLIRMDPVIRVPRDYPTVQAALDGAGAGEIIQVDAGIYAENLIITKPVTLIAQSFDEINPANNVTVIDGGGGAATILIPPGLTQMPTIRGFVIRNGVNGIQASSAFIAESNFFLAAGNLVSYQQGGGGINRNNVYFSAANNAIRLDNSDRALLIENNRIMYSGETGIEISLQNTIVPPAVVEINIWNNIILGNREDGIQFVDFPQEPHDTNRRFVIAGNLLANNAKAGIGLMPNANTLEDYSGADTLEALRVFNNTFYGNDHGISGGDNLVAFNNIIANSLTRGVWRVQGAPGANSVVAYTLFHNNGVDAEETILGEGVILGVDPLFQAAPNPGPDGTWETVDDDFSGLVLRSGSPAIDKGVVQFRANNGELIPPSPLSGFTGAAPDLGWREFGAPIFITPTPTLRFTFTPPPTATAVVFTPLPTQTLVPGSPTAIPLTATPETPAPLPTMTLPPASPTVTASPPPPTATSTVNPSPQMTIQSINPNSAQANTSVGIIIAGAGFQNGAVVTFEGGQGLPQQVVSVQVVDPGTIIVTVNTQNDGTAGPQVWDVRVTNPDNSTAVLVDAFTVAPPP